MQNSLGDLVSLWIMQGSSENQTSIGNAIIELGRLETWLLRQARGDLESDNLLGTFVLFKWNFFCPGCGQVD